MAVNSVNITADGSYFLCDVRKSIDAMEYSATIHATGTWGSGTPSLSFQTSVDGGSTKVTQNDTSGSAFSFSANGSCRIKLDNYVKLDNYGKAANGMKLYANLAGSSGANLTVTVSDNT